MRVCVTSRSRACGYPPYCPGRNHPSERAVARIIEEREHDFRPLFPVPFDGQRGLHFTAVLPLENQVPFLALLPALSHGSVRNHHLTRCFEVAHQAAEHLIEYWETRIISHADAEEDGFYQEMAGKNPGLQDAVLRLARDHDLMRIIVQDVKVMLAEEGLTPGVLHQFHALLVVNAVHSRDEERLLFGEA